MSHVARYIILTLVLIELIILSILTSKDTGIIVASEDNVFIKNIANEKYYSCIKYCEEKANNAYSTEYYGTTKWNDVYNDCWNNQCQKFAN
ncbi:MAG: hypothetical protein ACP5N1_06180 [Candidatus Woesearchaeota archaeon]